MKEARRHAYNRWTDGTKRCAGRSDYSYITPRIVVVLFISVTTRGVIYPVLLFLAFSDASSSYGIP